MELAEAHWAYVEELLRTHQCDELTLQLCRFHYVSAFNHGYKHGIEELVARLNLPSNKSVELSEEKQ